MIIELMLVSMAVLFVIFLAMLFILAVTPKKKHSKKKVKEDLHAIKNQINGDD